MAGVLTCALPIYLEREGGGREGAGYMRERGICEREKERERERGEGI